MAEVINIPKVDGSHSALTREKSSLESGAVKVKAEVINEERGIAKLPRKTFGQKVKETFIKDDILDVRDYIVWDIIFPAIGRTINEIICGASNRIFLGGPSPSSNLYRQGGVTYVRQGQSYSTVSTQRASQRRLESRATPAPAPSSRNSFEVLDLIFDDYAKVQQTLDEAIDYLDTYGQISVDAYSDILAQHFEGVPKPHYTAQNWGWTSLANATIVNAVGGGYFIKLPQPVVVRER